MFKLRADDPDKQTSRQLIVAPEDRTNKRIQIAITVDMPDATAAAGFQLGPTEVVELIGYLEAWLEEQGS
jgi:hypothetical protein